MLRFTRNTVKGMSGSPRSEVVLRTVFTIGATVVRVTKATTKSATLVCRRGKDSFQTTIKRGQSDIINGAEVYVLRCYENCVDFGFEAPMSVKINRADKI